MIANVQALRAVAAFMIVLIHSSALLDPFGVEPAAWLFAGVDVFFVISGFIMVFVSRERKPGAAQFMADRVIRIVPVYWLFTLLIFAANRLMPWLGDWTATGADLARSLLFIPYGDPPNFPPLVYVGWSLNMEMYFYALFAIGLWSARRVEVRVAVVSALIFLPFIIAQFQPASSRWQFYGSPMIFEFVLGMGLALLHDRLVQLPALVGIALCVTGFAAIAADPLLPFTEVTFVRFAVPAAMLVAGALVCEARGLRASWRPLLELGAASYVLYVSHPLVMSVFNNLQERRPALETSEAALLLFCVALIAALAFAWLLHRLFELPVTRVLKRRLHLRRSVRQPDLAG